MEDDNSELAKKCSKWGNDGSHYVGKWGHHRKKNEFRMYDHTAFIANLHHWIIFKRVGNVVKELIKLFQRAIFGKFLSADVVLIYHTMSTSANFE